MSICFARVPFRERTASAPHVLTFPLSLSNSKRPVGRPRKVNEDGTIGPKKKYNSWVPGRPGRPPTKNLDKYKDVLDKAASDDASSSSSSSSSSDDESMGQDEEEAAAEAAAKAAEDEAKAKAERKAAKAKAKAEAEAQIASAKAEAEAKAAQDKAKADAAKAAADAEAKAATDKAAADAKAASDKAAAEAKAAADELAELRKFKMEAEKKKQELHTQMLADIQLAVDIPEGPVPLRGRSSSLDSLNFENK